MALNLRPELIDAPALKSNLRAAERHLNDDHYVRGFTPGDFELLTATVLLGTGITENDWPLIEMADAVNSHAAVSWRKPSEWRSGKLRVRYWYTSDVGSASNFVTYLSLRAARVDEVLPSTSLLIDQRATAGPAVAWTVKRSDWIYTTTSLGNDDEIISLRLARLGGDASDTNVNDFLLMYVTVEHIPAVLEAQ